MLAQIIQPGTQEQRNTLEYFGLSIAIFQEVGEKIFGSYSQSTPNDVRTAAGSYAYFTAIRALRDILCPSGWHPHREGNIEMILPSSSEFAITASSGDKNTGRIGRDPKTKNSKGSQTDAIVSKNQWLWPPSYELFPEMESDNPPYNPDKTPTWFLLYHIDSVNNETRMELSLPINVDIYTLKVDRWKQRIILPGVKFDSTPIKRTNQQELYSDFDIEIKRKVNE
jgi:hypothetical protein